MHALPTSLSIMCTTLSAITIIGRDPLTNKLGPPESGGPTLGPDLGGPDRMVQCNGQCIPEKRNTSRVLFVWRNVFLDDLSLLSVNDLRIKGDTFKYLLSTVPTIITTSKAAIINSHFVDPKIHPLEAAEVYIPIFYRLGIRSTYEYLELRFKLVFKSLPSDSI